MSLCGQAHESLTVNCFTRRFPEWLPQISEGDVVILVDLKVRYHSLSFRVPDKQTMGSGCFSKVYVKERASATACDGLSSTIPLA